MIRLPFKRIGLTLALLLLGTSAAHAQLSTFSGRAVSNISTLGPTRAVVLGPVQYGQVRVCNTPATGSPCTPIASIFDLNGNPLNVSGGNFGQVQTDVTGFYSFQCVNGVYEIQEANASGSPLKTYLATCPAVNSTSILATNNIFTGTNAFNGGLTTTTTNSTGAGTHSGTETFTGAINCTIINAVRCVSPSNPQGWAGADVGAWINAAYANCAAASLTICPIQVAAGSYASSATLINFSTLGVFPQLQCATETQITFSATSGTAITLNPGRAGLPTDWGIQGCHFVGSGLGNTLTAILSGGSNGAVGAALRGIHVHNFNIALTFGTNVQGWLLDHSVIADNNQNLTLPAGQTQTGEGIIFQNSTFGNTSAVWNANCISIGNAGATFYDLQFIGGSIDQCPFNAGTGSDTTFSQVHWENPVNVAMSVPYVTVSGGTVKISNSLMVSEQTNLPTCSVIATCFIDSKSAASITISNLYALNNSSAMAAAVHVCATCLATLSGNIVNFGSGALPEYVADTGGVVGRIGAGSIDLINGSAVTAEIRANTGQTIAGVAGTLFGWLQAGVAHLGEIDTSGNMGLAGKLNLAGAPAGSAGSASFGSSGGVGQLNNNNGTTFNIAQVITATSAAFATATTAGTCVQNTTAVAGATTAMAVKVSPVSTPGVGAVWAAFVSSAGNVTINECAVATSAGGTIAFNIRVTP